MLESKRVARSVAVAGPSRLRADSRRECSGWAKTLRAVASRRNPVSAPSVSIVHNYCAQQFCTREGQ